MKLCCISNEPSLSLSLFLSLFAQSGDSEVVLEDGSKSMFYYIQLLHSQQQKPDKMKRIWDNPYTLVYQERGAMSSQGWSPQYLARHIGTDRLPKGDIIQYLQRKAKVCHECMSQCPTGTA